MLSNLIMLKAKQKEMQFIQSVVSENYTIKLISNEIKVNYRVITDSKTIAENVMNILQMLPHTSK